MNQGEKQLMISLNRNDVSKVKEILSLSIENNEYIRETISLANKPESKEKDQNANWSEAEVPHRGSEN